MWIGLLHVGYYKWDEIHHMGCTVQIIIIIRIADKYLKLRIVNCNSISPVKLKTDGAN